MVESFNPTSQANVTGFSLLCTGALILGVMAYSARKTQGGTAKTLANSSILGIVLGLCLMICALGVLFMYD
jgi:hypothetical protein